MQRQQKVATQLKWRCKVKSPLQICVIRHGETAWSLTGQHTGLTDLALTPAGEKQACSLAPRLAQTGFAHILVSPSLRARQTCALAGCSLTSTIDPELAEWNYGDYEGLRTDDIRVLRPGWSVWRDGCPNGEMPEQVAQRADRVIARLIQLRGRIALFTHGQFGTALAMRWIGSPVAQGQHFPMSPASLSWLELQTSRDDLRIITSWNECLYLSQS